MNSEQILDLGSSRILDVSVHRLASLPVEPVGILSNSDR